VLPVKALLTVGDTRTEVVGHVAYNTSHTDGRPNLKMYYNFEVPGKSIGLKQHADKMIDVKFDMSAVKKK